jgi:UPF0755 protein
MQPCTSSRKSGFGSTLRSDGGFIKWAVILGLFVVFVLIPIGGIAYFALTPHEGAGKKPVIVLIRKGEPPMEISRVLRENGLISTSRGFLWLGRIGNQWKHTKAGEYELSPALSPIRIFAILIGGVSVKYPITVREGENMYEIADNLEEKKLASKKEFIELCRNRKFIATFFKADPPLSLEGYLYPDTYFFNRTLSASDMIRQMVKHFFELWGTESENRARTLGLSLHQTITLASIIEKETGAAEERALISSVFHNRLQKKMKLQSDPTTIYGIWDRFEGKLHKADLSAENPFNTYYVSALPIGPISNPGKEAIQAALYPEASEYLFFVSHNDGTHQFSKTLEDHNRAVRKYQLNPKAREGKSWRDHVNL